MLIAVSFFQKKIFFFSLCIKDQVLLRLTTVDFSGNLLYFVFLVICIVYWIPGTFHFSIIT